MNNSEKKEINDADQKRDKCKWNSWESYRRWDSEPERNYWPSLRPGIYAVVTGKTGNK